MSKRELLLKKIKENNGIITTREALNLGIHKDILKELTIKEELEKIANGLYALPDENIDEYLYFSYRIPKGIFSHETAAYLQGLSTRMAYLRLIQNMFRSYYLTVSSDSSLPDLVSGYERQLSQVLDMMIYGILEEDSSKKGEK